MAERSERPDGGPERPPAAPRRKGPLDQLVDLTVYAPIGLFMSLDEWVPQLVEKGHQHVQVARFFGRMAVRTGSEEAKRRFVDARPRRTPDTGEDAKVVPLRPVPTPTAPSRAQAAPPAEPAPPASSLGIPDYDVLSASQVVPRLPGLGPDELDAVRRYEAANRGRKTILAKIAQLQA